MKAIAAIFDLLPNWLWAAALAVVVAFGTAQTMRISDLKTDIADLKREKAEDESQRLREANRELSRLVGVTNKLNEANREQLATIDDLERRARAAGVRVTKAERDAAIAAGSAEAVSRYAIVAGDTYQACRDEYRTLGYEAARGSAAAHTLKQWADQWPRTFDEAMKLQVQTMKGTAK